MKDQKLDTILGIINRLKVTADYAKKNNNEETAKAIDRIIVNIWKRYQNILLSPDNDSP